MVTPWHASVGFEGPAPEDGWSADTNIALVCNARWTDTHGALMDDSESYSATGMCKHSSKTPCRNKRARVELVRPGGGVTDSRVVCIEGAGDTERGKGGIEKGEAIAM